MSSIILGIVVKSSAILAIAFAATLIARHRSAALRHWIWTAGLLGALTAPLFGMILPAWQPGVPAISISTGPPIAAPQTARSAASAVIAHTRSFEFQIPQNHRPSRRTALTIWSIGAALIAGLLLIEISKLVRVASRSVPATHRRWSEIADEIRQALQLRRPVRLLWNSQSSVLGTWGTFRPRILFPRQSDSWTEQRLRAVLTHEISHVKRNDWLIQAVAEIAKVIYWFNPLFWLVCSQLRRESEFACDDAALRLGIDGPSYAEHVLDLVRTLNRAERPGAMALAMAGTSNLERRMIAMLNPSVNRRAVGKGTLAGIVVTSLALTLPIAAMQTRDAEQKVAVLTEVAAASTPIALPVKSSVVAGSAGTPQIGIVPLTEGVISGTVVASDGALIPGVAVTVKESSSGFVRSMFTNDSGAFTVAQLPPGDYTMTTSLPGFDTALKDHIDVASGQQTNVSTMLQVAVNVSVTVEISVSSSSQAVSSGQATTVSEPYQYVTKSETTIVSRVPIRSATPTTPSNGPRSPIRIGGNIQAGHLQYSPKPTYPGAARQLGLEGTATFSAIIASDGHIREIRIVSTTDPLFSDAALPAIQNWMFKPTLLDGMPVEVVTSITANFRLSN